MKFCRRIALRQQIVPRLMFLLLFSWIVCPLISYGEVKVHSGSSVASGVTDFPAVFVNVGWDAPFSDTNYLAVCSIEGRPNPGPAFTEITAKSTAFVRVAVPSEATEPTTVTVNCIGVQRGQSPMGLMTASSGTVTLPPNTGSRRDIRHLVLQWTQAASGPYTAICGVFSADSRKDANPYSIVTINSTSSKTISLSLRNGDESDTVHNEIECIGVPNAAKPVLGVTEGSVAPVVVTGNGDDVTSHPVTLLWNTAPSKSSYVPVCSPTSPDTSQVNRLATTVQSVGPTSIVVDISILSDYAQSIGVNCLAHSGQEITLVDPVPDLLAGPQVTSTASDLASKGNSVSGVAADGVTKIVLRIPTAKVGDTLDLTLLNDKQGPSSSPCGLGEPCEDGFLSNLDGSLGGASLTTPPSTNINGIPLTFALYTAPADFVRDGNRADATASQRQVFLKASGIPLSTINIVRPPVVFIHGIWSNPLAWKTLATTLPSQFTAYFVNYKPTNFESVKPNAVFALAQFKGMLDDFKQRSNIAAVQFDVVAHSMGGLIARDMVPDTPNYFTSANYNAGWIHKLITIDSPHAGTELATRLNDSGSLCKALFASAGNPVAGAVADLDSTSTGTGLINRLNQGPSATTSAHVIVGQSNPSQEELNFVNYQNLPFISSVCGLLPPMGFEALFKGPSDLLVPINSQQAVVINGPNNGCSDSFGATCVFDVIHAAVSPLLLGPAVLDSSDTEQAVLGLLNTSKMSNSATSGFVKIRP